MSKRKAQGSASAILAIKLKLAELHDQQNEKENVRGFTDGGASNAEEKESEEDLATQIEYLEKELSEFEVRMQSAILDLQEVVADMRKATEDNKASTNNYDEMENLANQYRALGIDCEVNLGDCGYEINVANDGNFAGENLLEMSARDVSELLEEIEKELLMEGGVEKSEEKSTEKESKNEQEGIWKKDERFRGLMPGDVLEKKVGEESSKNKSKKESPLKNVEPGEPFDHGLGRASFSSGKGNWRGK